MRYLLDSNVLIYATRPEAQFAPFRRWAERDDVAVSAILRVEVIGFHKLTTTDALYYATAFDVLTQLPISDAVLDRAVKTR